MKVGVIWIVVVAAMTAASIVFKGNDFMISLACLTALAWAAISNRSKKNESKKSD